MIELPRRTSLVAQVADILRRRLERGEWKERLPGEYTICEQLQVSRSTLRQALAILAREGRVRSQAGFGWRIRLRPHSNESPAVPKRVGLLCFLPLDQASPFNLYQIEKLQDLLHRAGCDVQIHAGARYTTQNYRSALDKLANHARASHWILIGPTARVQRWFWERKIPAFVTFTDSKQIGLPHLNLDNAALYRHAVATIVRGGHLRFALIVPRYSAVRGEFLHDEFWNEVRHYQERPGISMQMVTHVETRDSIRRAVDSLLQSAKPPTALLILRPKHALAVLTHLTYKGVRVPQQIALLCVGHTPLIDNITPSIAHYTTDVKSYTRKLSRVILPWVLKGEVPSAHASVLPAFHEGESFAPLATHP